MRIVSGATYYLYPRVRGADGIFAGAQQIMGPLPPRARG